MSAARYSVRAADEIQSFPRMLATLRETFSYRKGIGRPLLGFGAYANILDLGTETALAISTDGVGTKILIAAMMRQFDTIGVDCIAMNVNDVICVGAEPIAMTDYVAVPSVDDDALAQLAVGLRNGARDANITIPGGEIAQIPAIVEGGLDLVGTCVGLVEKDKLVIGDNIEDGDAIIGFASSGIHSNGLTLARDVLMTDARLQLTDYVPELACTLGEELLRPTQIYVRLAMELFELVQPRALAHITSDGFLNLRRFDSPIGFDIEWLPEPHAIFSLIADRGSAPIPAAEMYYVFNMGIGLCAIVPSAYASAAIECGTKLGIESWQIGHCISDGEKTVYIRPQNLRSKGNRFVAL